MRGRSPSNTANMSAVHSGPSLLMLVFYGLVMVQLWCCGPGTAVKTRSPSQQRLQRRVTRLILTVITGATH